MLESGTIRLCKLFDSDSKAVTIPKYLNFIEQNSKNVFGNETVDGIKIKLKEDRESLGEYTDTIGKLKMVRDKSLAHNDSKYTLKENDVWADAGITYGDIKEIIKFSGEVVNNYYG